MEIKLVRPTHKISLVIYSSRCTLFLGTLCAYSSGCLWIIYQIKVSDNFVAFEQGAMGFTQLSQVFA